MERSRWHEPARTTPPIPSTMAIHDPLQAEQPVSDRDLFQKLRNGRHTGVGGSDDNPSDTKDSTRPGFKHSAPSTGNTPAALGPSFSTVTPVHQPSHPLGHTVDLLRSNKDAGAAKSRDHGARGGGGPRASIDTAEYPQQTRGRSPNGAHHQPQPSLPNGKGQGIHNSGSEPRDDARLDLDLDSQDTTLANIISNSLSSSASSSPTALTTTTLAPMIAASEPSITVPVPAMEITSGILVVTADSKERRITTGGALRDPLPMDNQEDHSRSRSITRRTSRSRTISTPAQSRHPPMEFLTDMGPLEIHGENGSTVLPTPRRPSLATSAPRTISSSSIATRALEPPTPVPLCHLSHHPSSSTLVSESSLSSPSTADASSTLSTGRADQETEAEAEGMAWNGGHPLLVDYATESDILDGDNDHEKHYAEGAPSLAQDRLASNHQKEFSMSTDPQQERRSTSQQDSGTTEALSLGNSARRRRNASKTSKDDNWALPNTDDDRSHSRTTTDTTGRRVIIHQVTPMDTLAGIALFYGIQVSILKKSNKLWTNDSIHTRNYLYIPFEECTVTRQAGVMIDESSHTVILPQKIQQHSRAGSVIGVPGQTFASTASHLSTFEPAGPSNNSLPNSRRSDHQHRHHHSSSLQAVEEMSVEHGSRWRQRGPESSTTVFSMTPPPISDVAAGMLPNSSSHASKAAASSLVSPPHVDNWIDSESKSAHPVNSSTVTTTTLNSDNSLGATPVPIRRSATDRGGQIRGFEALSSAPYPENLTNTMIAPPSMTHETLAARFREMDLVTSEQQQRKTLGQEQELQTNPVHHRHRTSDLRQFASLQQSQQRQRLLEADASLPSSHSGSRRGSMDAGTHQEGLLAGSVGDYATTESTDELEQDRTEFVEYGRQQYIYDVDDLRDGSGLGGGSDGLEYLRDASETVTTLRRQELVTVPAGMLSFFPSREHSKRLETPHSISRIQDQVDNGSYPSSTMSSASTTASGSFRDALSQQERNGAGSRSKSRAALGGHTFQPPSSLPSSPLPTGKPSAHRPPALSGSHRVRPAGAHRRSPSSSSITHSLTPPSTPRGSTYPKTVRLSQQQLSPQKWSLMGESLVDDLLGAVRGPLQIARRMYNFTALGFGAALSGSSSMNGASSKGSSEYDPPAIVRRRSTAGTRSGKVRSSRNKEYRNSSGSAIELDQAGDGSTFASSSSSSTKTPYATGIMEGRKHSSISKRTPVAPSTSATANATSVAETMMADSQDDSRQATRRKSSSGGEHLRGISAGSNNSGTNSTRKRSLRSSNPINRAALMALVNEMDKDKREKDHQEKRKSIADADLNGSSASSGANGINDISTHSNGASSPCSASVVDILSTSS